MSRRQRPAVCGIPRVFPAMVRNASKLAQASLLEKDIQDGILALLWGVGIPAFHIPNRGLMDKATGRYNRTDSSFVPGVPDIAAPLPGGKTLWIEVKAAKGVVSDAQAAFHAKLRSKGHRVLIARTVRVVQDELEDLGIILR